MKRWLPLIDQIEIYARAEGCRRVRIFGRKGWLRALEGFEQKTHHHGQGFALMGPGRQRESIRHYRPKLSTSLRN